MVDTTPPTIGSFADAFGVPITYFIWEAPTEHGVVQIVHGFGEHASRYDELARRLNIAGYTVYANDHRGHGQTGLAQWSGRTDRLGYLGVGGIRAAGAAVFDLSGRIRQERPMRPLVLVAHSWGSVLAQMIINSRPLDLDGVVLTGTVYRMPGSMRGGDLNRSFRIDGGTGFEWLTRDPEVVHVAAADPLMTRVSSVRTLSIADTLRQFGRPRRQLTRPFPLRIMVGSEDAFGGTASATRLAAAFRRRSGLPDVELQVYDGARHEIFNETNREEVYDDLIRWLDRQTGVADR